MSHRALRLLPRRAELALVPVAPGCGIGLEAAALGLRRQMEQAAVEMGWDTDDIAPILTALSTSASLPQRRDAVLAMGLLYPDWRNTPKGRVEIRRCWAWIAPAANPDTLGDIATNLGHANDLQFHRDDRKCSRANAELLAAEAVGMNVTGVVRLPVRPTPDGAA